MGLLPGVASGDLSNKEGYLVQPTGSLSTTGGGRAVPIYSIVNAATLRNIFLLEEGNTDTKQIVVRPLEPNRLVRIKLAGTCTTGDALCLTSAGKVTRAALAGGGDTLIGYAQDDGVDGENVLLNIADRQAREGYMGVATLAALGSTQGTAAPIVSAPGTLISVTGADTAVGVVLPASTAGARFEVFNNAAATLKIYPPSSGTLNGGSANAAVTVAAKSTTFFRCLDGTDWAAAEAPAA